MFIAVHATSHREWVARCHFSWTKAKEINGLNLHPFLLQMIFWRFPSFWYIFLTLWCKKNKPFTRWNRSSAKLTRWRLNGIFELKFYRLFVYCEEKLWEFLTTEKTTATCSNCWMPLWSALFIHAHSFIFPCVSLFYYIISRFSVRFVRFPVDIYSMFNSRLFPTTRCSIGVCWRFRQIVQALSSRSIYL